MNEESTFGLSAEALAKLLSACSDVPAPPEADSDAAKTDALQFHLAAPFPPTARAHESVLAAGGDLRRLTGTSVRQLLADVQTPPEALAMIKDYGKELAASHDRPDEVAAGVAITFLAIAAAVVHHDRKISSYDYPALAESFENLAARAWMPADLAALLAEGAKRCRRGSG